MKTISFKVTPEEAREIRANARREHLTVSEFLRRQASAPVQQATRLQRTKCPKTGALVFGRIEKLPPLDVESTKEMLADFP